jgi:NAD(P)-dependent dehydrogenase (short-subunit alcohol dehydrogenase family)
MTETTYAGKVAFVTGASTGFGRAFSEAVAARGAAVALVDHNSERLARTVSALRSEGVDVHGVECDVVDEASVSAAVSSVIDRRGGIDILINNAARHLPKHHEPCTAQPTEQLRALFDVNVFGVIHCTLACHESMAQRAGEWCATSPRCRRTCRSRPVGHSLRSERRQAGVGGAAAPPPRPTRSVSARTPTRSTAALEPGRR